MPARNPHLGKLNTNYLFPEINQRKREFLTRNPSAKLISLGIGDTTEPIPSHIIASLIEGARKLGTREEYVGYGPEQGIDELRKRIALILYHDRIKPHEVFISDGAKCDLGRLQGLFGGNPVVAVQDPAYPVYVDGSYLMGVSRMVFLPCIPENRFFPDLLPAKNVDLIYFCSPNNPTGAVATRQQLEELVAFAKKNRSIIIYDSAYAAYITDPTLPKSIYEIEGAKEVAIEISSFSKLAGFTGVRLGWTIVPEELHYDDGTSVRKDWIRVSSTIFNGACNISQHGGLGILDAEGQSQTQTLLAFYMENAKIIMEALRDKGLVIHGGTSAPYLWVGFKGRNSWDVFQIILEKLHLITTPGSGFGPAGEGFIRFTAFGSRDHILEAAERIKRSPCLL